MLSGERGGINAGDEFRWRSWRVGVSLESRTSPHPCGERKDRGDAETREQTRASRELEPGLESTECVRRAEGVRAESQAGRD